MSKHSTSKAPKKVEKAIDDLVAFHDIGRACLDEYPEGMPPGVAKKLGQQYSLHHEIIRLARRFASPKHGGYSKRDLERLFGRSRRYRCAINRTCVTKLLTVEDSAIRSEIELEMIQEKWSRRDLDDELRLRFGKRKHAGRRLRRAKNTRDAALQILRAAEQAQRALEQYSTGHTVESDDPVRLSPGLQRAVTAANDALGELGKIAKRTVHQSGD